MLYIVYFENPFRDYPVVIEKTNMLAMRWINEQPDKDSFYIVEAKFGEDLD